MKITAALLLCPYCEQHIVEDKDQRECYTQDALTSGEEGEGG